ncbi:MAG: TetR/AcrR family transcriptional regulator [bacterium]
MKRQKHKQRRGQKPPGSTEARILAAAEKVFAEKGLKGARIVEVAALAQVPPSQINYHYGSKENLYRTVIENFYVSLQRRLFPIMMEEASPPAKLRKLISSGIDILAEKDHVARILLRESVDGGRYVNEMLSKPYLKETFEMADRFVYSNLRDRERHPNDTVHLISSILGCTTMFFVAASTIRELWKKDVYSARMIEERKKEVIEFVFHGIGDRFKP